MTVAIIDCGAGNLHSVEKAVRKVMGAAPSIVTDAELLSEATHIILPGVGAFADCMNGLHALKNMKEALEEAVLVQKKPFLGICVGMQMLFERGYEHGEHAGLGWLKGEVVPLKPADSSMKIPHMGWNPIRFEQDAHPLLRDIDQGAHMYFVHSYHAQPEDRSDVLLTCEYGESVVAAVARGNIMGTQFHPEKSQAAGLQLLKNFVGM